MFRLFFFKLPARITLVAIVLALGLASATLAEQPQLDSDYPFKPLTPGPIDNPAETPLQGNIQKQGLRPSITGSSTSPVLKIQVKTYQEAIETERDVDWYGWYLAARQYMAATGGLNQCTLGTPIKFYRQGRIEALSNDPFCQLSVQWRKFPLPTNTRLDALILPVRSGKLPPASQDEIKRRIQSNQSN